VPPEPVPPAVEIRDRWRTVYAPVNLSDAAVRAMFEFWAGFECEAWESDGALTDRLATDIVRDCWVLMDALADDRKWQRRFKERRIPRRGFSVAQALQELKRARRSCERRLAAKQKRGPKADIKGKRGRPQASNKQMREQEKILEDWEAAHRNGASQKDFARQLGMKPGELRNILAAVRQRRRRAAKPRRLC
jgi:hypothetical protein